MNRLQMEAHLTLHGWQPATWEAMGGGEFGLQTSVITHPDHGFYIFNEQAGSFMQGHPDANRYVEALAANQQQGWGMLPPATLRGLFTGLSKAGLV